MASFISDLITQFANYMYKQFFLHLYFLRNKILMQIIREKQEADCAMSWLSTLGGAFSALGEEFEHCVSCSFCRVTYGML